MHYVSGGQNIKEKMLGTRLTVPDLEALQTLQKELRSITSRYEYLSLEKSPLLLIVFS